MTPVLLLAVALAQSPGPLEALDAACAHADATAATSLFAEGATLRFVPSAGPPGRPGALPEERYEGRARIASFFQAQLAACRGTVLEASPTRDGAVQGRLRWSTGPWRAAGAESVELQADAELRDGKIARLDLIADPAAARLLETGTLAANAGQVRRFFEATNRGDPNALDLVLSEAVVQHSSLPVSPGRAGVRAYYAQFARAFPDAVFQVEDVIAQGDRVAVRLTIRATHRAEFLGVPATGKAILLQRVDLFRFENGRCVEHWDSVDRLGLLQQLGVLARDAKWGPSVTGSEGFR